MDELGFASVAGLLCIFSGLRELLIYTGILSDTAATAFVMIAFGASLLYMRRQKDDSKVSAQVSAASPDESALIDKAVSDFNHIQSLVKKITDPALATEVRKMQAMARKMLQHLDKHPEKAALASQFIDYYQGRTSSLLSQYMELSDTGLHEPISPIAEQLTGTFRGFVKAYEQEFLKLMHTEILDMNAELKVARQVLESEGISADAPSVFIVGKSADGRMELRKSTPGDKDQSDLAGFSSAMRALYGDVRCLYFNDATQKSLKKVKGAMYSYAREARKENVLFCYDETFFGSAEIGFLVTDRRIYSKGVSDKPCSIAHSAVRTVEVGMDGALKFIDINEDTPEHVRLPVALSAIEEAERIAALVRETSIRFGANIKE